MKNEMMSRVTGICTKVKENPRIQRVTAFLFMLVVSLSGSGVTAFADTKDNTVDFSGVTSPIVNLLNSFVTPLLTLVGAGGAIYCIFLGVKYATAEEPQEREKRKQALKTAIIGFVLIFVLIVALRLSIQPLSDWMSDASKSKTTK